MDIRLALLLLCLSSIGITVSNKLFFVYIGFCFYPQWFSSLTLNIGLPFLQNAEVEEVVPFVTVLPSKPIEVN